jgi:hypothetical protein
MYNKKMISVQDKRYIVIRTIRIDHNPNTDVWKEHLRADIVFRKKPYFYFCQEVTDVEWENLT